MNWALLAISVFTIATLSVAWSARRHRSSLAGVAVAIPLLLVAGLNGAAPVRGLVDPGYMGYVFGLLAADRGLAVTLLAGPLVILAIAAAHVAVTRRNGRPMWLVAATCAALALILGVPWAVQIFTDPSANIVQLGEYATIPGLAATLIVFGLLCLPFALGAVWASRAALRPAPTPSL